jgi:hypothetical protein
VNKENVVALPVKPRTMRRTYKGVQIILTFVVGTKRWKWKVIITNTMEEEGEAPTDTKALRAAEKFVDQVKGNK